MSSHFTKILFLVSLIWLHTSVARENCEELQGQPFREKISIVDDVKDALSKIHQAPDLIEELKGRNQSGGRIVITTDINGKIKVVRQELPKLSLAEELAQREETFKIFMKINIIKADEVQGIEIVPNQQVIALLHTFALSDVGAIWLRRVTDETIFAINKGYLSINSSKKSVLEMLTGELTIEAPFDNYTLLKITSYTGRGATATGNRINIGSELFGTTFSSSNQKVDPLAIISHEFGHTRYGDPTSGGSLEGEARTVKNFENPARLHHNHDERLHYCDPKTNTQIDINTHKIIHRVCSEK